MSTDPSTSTVSAATAIAVNVPTTTDRTRSPCSATVNSVTATRPVAAQLASKATTHATARLQPPEERRAVPSAQSQGGGGHPPVPAAHDRDERGHEQRANDHGVEQDPEREAGGDDAHRQIGVGAQREERDRQDQRGARSPAARCATARRRPPAWSTQCGRTPRASGRGGRPRSPSRARTGTRTR